MIQKLIPYDLLLRRLKKISFQKLPIRSLQGAILPPWRPSHFETFEKELGPPSGDRKPSVFGP